MLDSKTKILHYHVYMNMYGEMLQDLSHCEKYIINLIDNNELDEFEIGLRILIEKSWKR